jgi:hypothetical protein
MKLHIVLFVILASFGKVFSQNEYRTSFSNDPENKVEILQGSVELIIIGHASDEVIIETNYSSKNESEKTGLKPIQEPPNKDKAERAKGLTPLAASAEDNTDIGLTVEKTPGTFRIMGVSPKAMDKSYTIRMPDKAALMISDINHSPKSEVNISHLKGEINVTALNTNILITDVSGPIVANTTNGNVEIIYNRVAPEKPNAIASVNGYVDTTLPSNVKANFTLNSVNGEAYTDFDLQIDKNNMPNLSVANLQMTMIQGTVNGGGTSFAISTVNGDIYLRKKK